MGAGRRLGSDLERRPVKSVILRAEHQPLLVRLGVQAESWVVDLSP